MLPGHEQFDPTSLLFAVDAFPPATFDIDFSGWVPTLELTVYVRALPAQEWPARGAGQPTRGRAPGLTHCPTARRAEVRLATQTGARKDRPRGRGVQND